MVENGGKYRQLKNRTKLSKIDPNYKTTGPVKKNRTGPITEPDSLKILHPFTRSLSPLRVSHHTLSPLPRNLPRTEPCFSIFLISSFSLCLISLSSTTPAPCPPPPRFTQQTLQCILRWLSSSPSSTPPQSKGQVRSDSGIKEEFDAIGGTLGSRILGNS